MWLSQKHNFGKFIDSIVIFHCSKINDLEFKRNFKALILWVPTDQFHPIKNGVDLAGKLNKNRFVKLDTGIFSKKSSNEKGS